MEGVCEWAGHKEIRSKTSARRPMELFRICKQVGTKKIMGFTEALHLTRYAPGPNIAPFFLGRPISRRYLIFRQCNWCFFKLSRQNDICLGSKKKWYIRTEQKSTQLRRSTKSETSHKVSYPAVSMSNFWGAYLCEYTIDNIDLLYDKLYKSIQWCYELMFVRSRTAQKNLQTKDVFMVKCICPSNVKHIWFQAKSYPYHILKFHVWNLYVTEFPLPLWTKMVHPSTRQWFFLVWRGSQVMIYYLAMFCDLSKVVTSDPQGVEIKRSRCLKHQKAPFRCPTWCKK